MLALTSAEAEYRLRCNRFVWKTDLTFLHHILEMSAVRLNCYYYFIMLLCERWQIEIHYTKCGPLSINDSTAAQRWLEAAVSINSHTIVIGNRVRIYCAATT